MTCGSSRKSDFGLYGGTFRTDDVFVPIPAFCRRHIFLSNRGNHKAYTKLGAAVVLVALICAFLELVNRAGGSIGEKMAHLTVPALGVVGSYVIIVILMMICLILITQRSLLKSVQNAGRTLQVRQRLAGSTEKYSVRRRKRSKKPKRQEHKVAGVSFDTTLEGRSPEIQELVVTEEKSLKKKAEKRAKETEQQAAPKTQEEAPAGELTITRASSYEEPGEPVLTEAFEAVPDLSEFPEEGISAFKEAVNPKEEAKIRTRVKLRIRSRRQRQESM